MYWNETAPGKSTQGGIVGLVAAGFSAGFLLLSGFCCCCASDSFWGSSCECMLMFKRKSLKVYSSVVGRIWCGRASCRAAGGPEVRGISKPHSS